MEKVLMMIDENGDQSYRTTTETQVPRMPEAFEKWDAETKTFTKDHAGEADYNAGADHIAKVHARKTHEAALINAGYELDGMLLVQEANLRGITPLALSALVLAKSEAQIEVELVRIAAKNQIEVPKL